MKSICRVRETFRARSGGLGGSFPTFPSTHLILVNGQRILLQDQPLRAPQERDEALLLDGDGPAPYDVRAIDAARVAIGGSADAGVRRRVRRARGGRHPDRERGAVAGAGEHVVAAAGRGGGGARRRQGRRGDLVVRHVLVFCCAGARG